MNSIAPIQDTAQAPHTTQAHHAQNGSTPRGSTPSNRRLFEIGADLEALEALLEQCGGDISDPTVESAIALWFEEVHGDLGDKLDRYVGLIRSLEALAEAREAEVKRMLELTRADRNKANNLKERLKYFFQSRDIGKYDTPHFRLALVKNGGPIPLHIEAGIELPARFRRERTIIEDDKEALRAALEAGEAVEGARLGERGQSIRIK
jgi:hypothetical protein